MSFDSDVIKGLSTSQIEMLHWIANHPTLKIPEFNGYWGIDETKWNLSWKEIFDGNVNDCIELVSLGFLKSIEYIVADKGEKSYSFTINKNNYNSDVSELVDELYKAVIDLRKKYVEQLKKDKEIDDLLLIKKDEVVDKTIKIVDIVDKVTLEEVDEDDELIMLRNKIKQIEEKKSAGKLAKENEGKHKKEIAEKVEQISEIDDEW